MSKEELIICLLKSKQNIAELLNSSSNNNNNNNNNSNIDSNNLDDDKISDIRRILIN